MGNYFDTLKGCSSNRFKTSGKCEMGRAITVNLHCEIKKCIEHKKVMSKDSDNRFVLH